MIIAIVAEPGMPIAISGIRAPPTAALLAESETAKPPG